MEQDVPGGVLLEARGRYGPNPVLTALWSTCPRGTGGVGRDSSGTTVCVSLDQAGGEDGAGDCDCSAPLHSMPPQLPPQGSAALALQSPHPGMELRPCELISLPAKG